MALRQQMRETMRQRWQVRRRRRLLFIVGRFVVLLAVLGVIAWWFGGGRWGTGFIIVAGVMLLVRLGLFYFNGRRFNRRMAQGDESNRPGRA